MKINTEIKRDNDGKAHIVALSGGKDSTALALRLLEVEPRNYTYVITPTGDELPEMFEHWNKLSEMLGGIYPITGGTLKTICRDEGCLPNFRMRFCTLGLKIKPFKAFMLKAMPAIAYVGLRADEEHREGVTYEAFGDQLSTRHPLREWGWGYVK